MLFQNCLLLDPKGFKVGEYRSVAERLLNRIDNRLLAKDVPDIVKEAVGTVNCYPGTPGAGCCSEAYFISLNDSRRHGRGHLKFSVAIQKFVRHMEDCKGTTHVAVIITDTWDAGDLREWKGRIEPIKQHAHVEAYLISGDSITEVPI